MLVTSYVAAYLTGEMVWVVPTLVASGHVAAGVDSKTPTTRRGLRTETMGTMETTAITIVRLATRATAQSSSAPITLATTVIRLVTTRMATGNQFFLIQ